MAGFAEVRFKGGKISDKNFGSYKLPRFSWLPEIETVLINDQEAPPQGGGEPAIICMGGVIANAVFDATGRLVRQLALQRFSPGYHRLEWDGRDEMGRATPSGVYYLRFRSLDRRDTKPILRMR